MNHDLAAALALLARVHTKDDARAGYVVPLGAMPDDWDRRDYIEAWGTVRKYLGYVDYPCLPNLEG